MREEDFIPRPGPLGSLFDACEPRFLNQVLRSAARMGGMSRARGVRRRAGSGRGAGAARVLSLRHKDLGPRPVMVVTRICKVKGKFSAAQKHLRYLQREGVGREELRGRLYDAHTQAAEGRSFLNRCREDRHQFRIVVAIGDGWEYDDLRGFTRRLLQQMERDLGSELQWVAADHYNTGFPHTHVVLRGVDEAGRDLVIAREYLNTGMPARASDIAALDLGPRRAHDPRLRARTEIAQLGPTASDLRLCAEAGGAGHLRLAGTGYDSFTHSLLAARLQTLLQLDLVEEGRAGHWHLKANLMPTLQGLAGRDASLDLLGRAIARHGLWRSARARAVYDPLQGEARPLVGRLLDQGTAREARGYVVVDASDGRSCYVDLGQLALAALPGDAVLAVRPRPVAPSPLDRSIAAVAAAHGGCYSVPIHMAHDPALRLERAQAHAQRLIELQVQLDVPPPREGTWQIGAGFLSAAARHARAQARHFPVQIELLSAAPLARQLDGPGATWLDRALVGQPPLPMGDSGFGHELGEALAQRRQWLLARRLGWRDQDGQIRLRADMLALLQPGAPRPGSPPLRGARDFEHAPGRDVGDTKFCSGGRAGSGLSLA